MNEMSGACGTLGERTVAYRVLVGRPEGKRTLGRTRHRWENNIKMDLQGMQWGGMNWIGLGLERDRLGAFADSV
jgi:hypothetical protein